MSYNIYFIRKSMYFSINCPSHTKRYCTFAVTYMRISNFWYPRTNLLKSNFYWQSECEYGGSYNTLNKILRIPKIASRPTKNRNISTHKIYRNEYFFLMQLFTKLYGKVERSQMVLKVEGFTTMVQYLSFRSFILLTLFEKTFDSL